MNLETLCMGMYGLWVILVCDRFKFFVVVVFALGFWIWFGFWIMCIWQWNFAIWINGFRHLHCEWFVHSRMEKGVASAIWWIRSTMLQVWVNLNPFLILWYYSYTSHCVLGSVTHRLTSSSQLLPFFSTLLFCMSIFFPPLIGFNPFVFFILYL